jgi:hypothetical protein
MPIPEIFCGAKSGPQLEILGIQVQGESVSQGRYLDEFHEDVTRSRRDHTPRHNGIRTLVKGGSRRGCDSLDAPLRGISVALNSKTLFPNRGLGVKDLLGKSTVQFDRFVGSNVSQATNPGQPQPCLKA